MTTPVVVSIYQPQGNIPSPVSMMGLYMKDPIDGGWMDLQSHEHIPNYEKLREIDLKQCMDGTGLMPSMEKSEGGSCTNAGINGLDPKYFENLEMNCVSSDIFKATDQAAIEFILSKKQPITDPKAAVDCYLEMDTQNEDNPFQQGGVIWYTDKDHKMIQYPDPKNSLFVMAQPSGTKDWKPINYIEKDPTTGYGVDTIKKLNDMVRSDCSKNQLPAISAWGMSSAIPGYMCGGTDPNAPAESPASIAYASNLVPKCLPTALVAKAEGGESIMSDIAALPIYEGALKDCQIIMDARKPDDRNGNILVYVDPSNPIDPKRKSIEVTYQPDIYPPALPNPRVNIYDSEDYQTQTIQQLMEASYQPLIDAAAKSSATGATRKTTNPVTQTNPIPNNLEVYCQNLDNTLKWIPESTPADALVKDLCKGEYILIQQKPPDLLSACTSATDCMAYVVYTDKSTEKIKDIKHYDMAIISQISLSRHLQSAEKAGKPETEEVFKEILQQLVITHTKTSSYPVNSKLKNIYNKPAKDYSIGIAHVDGTGYKIISGHTDAELADIFKYYQGKNMMWVFTPRHTKKLVIDLEGDCAAVGKDIHDDIRKKIGAHANTDHKSYKCEPGSAVVTVNIVGDAASVAKATAALKASGSLGNFKVNSVTEDDKEGDKDSGPSTAMIVGIVIFILLAIIGGAIAMNVGGLKTKIFGKGGYSPKRVTFKYY